jgi:dihydroflavonol-4-reductase
VILVTGGAGFIGRHLVRRLVERGDAVRVLDRTSDHFPSDLLPRVEFLVGDIRDPERVRAAVRGCREVYHLAANPQLWTRRRGDFEHVNHRGARNVIDAALAAGAERVLHTSTESILTRAGQHGPIREDQPVRVSDVIGPYCRSKYFAERYALRLGRAGAPVVVVNPTLPIGPGDFGRSPPTQMMLDFCLGKRPAYLDAELNLIDVRDVAEGMVLAMERGRFGRRYLLGGESWSIRSVFQYLAGKTGVPEPKWRVPYAVALMAAYASEWWSSLVTHEIPAATVTGVKLTRRTMHFDASRSLEEIGLTPRPVSGAIDAALEWFRTRKWVGGIAEEDANRPA